MILMVRSGNKLPFHPKLRLESTGYCPSGQWTCTIFHSQATAGLESIYKHPTVAQAIGHYFSELKRTGHVAVK